MMNESVNTLTEGKTKGENSKKSVNFPDKKPILPPPKLNTNNK